MAWNSVSNKQAQNASIKSIITPGAPVAFNPNQAGKPYKDSWDIDRAYREGFQRVVWVNRCIDAIAGNQSRLPVILRRENSPDGEKVTRKTHPLLRILNSKANYGENAFVFRYRLSSQLLMSSRGAFIEIIRGRDGGVIGLQLLPPGHTSPIPDKRKFVSGYEVDLRNGTKTVIPPNDVIWIRKPHPLDPYLSLTPMESAGIAIEIENLSKVYNRNFLINDGRPGGLIVVRGEIDDDDKDELRNRFRGNLGRAGAVTVVSSDEGVDFVDTGANPRDANYIQMRQITKEEILAAFGVPESVIGNAAGRTFSNAAEEHRVFWNETMMPHLELMGRGLDELDDEFYVDFDVDDVPVLVLYKQERERYLMQEFQAGLITGNEYRDGTGRKTIESDLMQALLANPNLTPIGYTDKPFNSQEQAQQQQAAMAAAQGGMPGAPGQPQQGLAPPGQPPGIPGSLVGESGMVGEAPPAEGARPETMTEALAAEAGPGVPANQETMEMPMPPGMTSAYSSEMQVKSGDFFEFRGDEWDTKADDNVGRWTEILDNQLERFFERQQRVVLEKAMGAKAKKQLSAGGLKIETVFDEPVWNKQMTEDLRPIFSGIAVDAGNLAEERSGMPAEFDEEEFQEYLDAQVKRVESVNANTRKEIEAAILIASSLDDKEDKSGLLKAALAAVFVNLLMKRRRVIAEHESQTAFNAGTYFAAKQVGAVNKTWITKRDSRVRADHVSLHGKSVGLTDSFAVDGLKIRFPGDPVAPPHLTINCRCKLRFDI
ncbi:MAG: phage portal protein [Ilumatobacteraceae bacterium]